MEVIRIIGWILLSLLFVIKLLVAIAAIMYYDQFKVMERYNLPKDEFIRGAFEHAIAFLFVQLLYFH